MTVNPASEAQQSLRQDQARLREECERLRQLLGALGRGGPAPAGLQASGLLSSQEVAGRAPRCPRGRVSPVRPESRSRHVSCAWDVHWAGAEESKSVSTKAGTLGAVCPGSPCTCAHGEAGGGGPLGNARGTLRVDVPAVPEGPGHQGCAPGRTGHRVLPGRPESGVDSAGHPAPAERGDRGRVPVPREGPSCAAWAGPPPAPQRPRPPVSWAGSCERPVLLGESRPGTRHEGRPAELPRRTPLARAAASPAPATQGGRAAPPWSAESPERERDRGSARGGLFSASGGKGRHRR